MICVFLFFQCKHQAPHPAGTRAGGRSRCPRAPSTPSGPRQVQSAEAGTPRPELASDAASVAAKSRAIRKAAAPAAGHHRRRGARQPIATRRAAGCGGRCVVLALRVLRLPVCTNEGSLFFGACLSDRGSCSTRKGAALENPAAALSCACVCAWPRPQRGASRHRSLPAVALHPHPYG